MSKYFKVRSTVRAYIDLKGNFKTERLYLEGYVKSLEKEVYELKQEIKKLRECINGK